jgi:tetratricopeptide (TPR) repeat protein
MNKKSNFWVRFGSGVVALLITFGLYFSKTPPFSLLEAQKEVPAEAGATLEPTEVPAQPAEAPVVSGEKLLIIAAEPFDQTIKENSETHKMKEGADTWTRTITLINPSTEPVTVYLFVQGVDICPEKEPKNCVQFPPKVTTKADGTQPVDITFTKIALDDDKPMKGKLILAGGDIQKEYPFSIQGEWQKEYDYAGIAAWVMTGLLVLGVLYILYCILYLKVIPALLSERHLPLRMDITEDTKNLWAIFSNRLREMQEQGFGRSLTNPQPKGDAIELPTNLGKEGDLFKAVVELLNWILPRRGVSIRLQSMESKISGKGISVALVQNNQGQNLAGRIFWTGDYSLDPETMDFEDLLMIPIGSWIHDWWDKRYPHIQDRKVMDWGVQAYCMLAGKLWSKDSALGKRLYMEALFRDPTNRQAQAGLGRIWIEDAQQDGITAYEKKNRLELAVAYLEEVTQKSPKPQDVIWFAAKYNLAVARLYQGEKVSAKNVCDNLFENMDNPPKPLIEGLDEGFDLWLRKFRSMALVFWHSVYLENYPPKNQQELDRKIEIAIKALTLADNQKGKGGETPAPDTEIAQNAEIAPDPKKWLLVDLDYRSQFNAACYFSRCYHLAKKKGWEKENQKYAEAALDYLRLALGRGGDLVTYAWKDQVLEPIRTDTLYREKFEAIAPKKEKAKSEKKECADSVLRLVLDEPEDDFVSLLPGITAEQVEAFQTLSIRTRSDLLLNGVDVDSRKLLQKKTRVKMEQLLWWLNLCDLTRIPGLDLYSAVLLEDKGKVDTVKELRKRDAGKLYELLGHRIAKETLLEWISSAKELITSLEY